MSSIRSAFLSAAIFVAGATIENETNLLYGSGEMECNEMDTHYVRCMTDVGVMGRIRLEYEYLIHDILDL